MPHPALATVDFRADEIAPRERSRLRSLALRAAITVPLVTVVIWRLDLWQVLANLRWLRPGWLIAAVVVHLLSQVISACRWAALARPVGFQAGQARFVRLYFEGMFFNLCLPGAIGGDVVKAYRLANDTQGRVLAGCTVLADRVTGVLALSSIGLLAVLHQTWSLLSLRGFLVAFGVTLCAAAACLAGLELLRRSAGAIRRPKRLTKVVAQLRPYFDKPKVLCGAVTWSFLVQGLNIACVTLVGSAIGLSVPAVAYPTAVPAAAIMSILPISLAGIGVREGSLAVLLAPYGASSEQAVTLGLTWFLVSVACGLVGGLVYLLGQSRQANDPAGALVVPMVRVSASQRERAA